jgi:type IV pilus assembly protein PilW
MRRQAGFNLIELMIAMVLGLIVSLGITQVFLSAKNTYVSQDAAAGIQEDARFVLSKMLQEIRMVGMFGCLQAITPPTTNGNLFTQVQAKSIDYTTSTTTGNVLTLITADVGTSGGAPTWSVIYDCKAPSVAFAGTPPPDATVGKQVLPIRKVVYTYSLKNKQLSTTVGTVSSVLINNVEKFDVSFGLASSVTDKVITSYVTTVPADPNLIRTVRITMQLSDPTLRAASQTFNVVAALRNRIN